MYAHALLSPKWGSRGLTNLTRLACFLLLQWATYTTVARLRAYLADEFKMGVRPQLCCHVFISHFLRLPSFSCASWDWCRYCNYRLRAINLERDWKNVPLISPSFFPWISDVEFEIAKKIPNWYIVALLPPSPISLFRTAPRIPIWHSFISPRNSNPDGELPMEFPQFPHGWWLLPSQKNI